MRAPYRLMLITVVVLCIAVGLLAQSRPMSQSAPNSPAFGGQGVMFFVRHAEAGAGNEAGLSELGRIRAISLAAQLKDAGITAIYVSETQRARETAAPLANSLGLTPAVIRSNDSKELAYKVRRTGGNTLIVGHANTIPGVMQELGLPYVAIGEGEYDNLFIAVPASYGARLIRLHYR